MAWSADREVGDVGVWNESVAGLELDGRSSIADERAVVDDGRRLAAVVADADAVAVVENERRLRDLGALVARVSDSAVVERPRLVHRHVDAVAQVVAERRTIEDAPAALVRYIHAVVAVVVDSTRVHQHVTCSPQPHFDRRFIRKKRLRPHRITMDAAYCDKCHTQRGLSVCWAHG